MKPYFSLVLAILAVSVPAHAVKSNPTVSLTWDGQFVIEPPNPVYPGNLSGTWAKLHFDVRNGCSGFTMPQANRGGDIASWPHQLDPIVMGNTQCSGSGCTALDATGVDAFISYDAFVRPGGAYLFSGRATCIQSPGSNSAWDSPDYYTEVVKVPPVFEGIQIVSTKTFDDFNRLKVGENLRIAVKQDTPANTPWGGQIPLRKTLIVEGAGIAKREYELSSYGFDNIEDLTPTTTGALTLKLRVEGYVYYADHADNTQLDWTNYWWKEKTAGNPALYSDEVFCSHDELCDDHGMPKYCAEPFRVESEVLELPVGNDWCVIQKRSGVFDKDANSEEGCAACSSNYQAYYDIYGDYTKFEEWFENNPCNGGSSDGGGNGGSDNPKKPDGGCSAAGTAGPSGYFLLALLPVLLRRRAVRRDTPMARSSHCNSDH